MRLERGNPSRGFGSVENQRSPWEESNSRRDLETNCDIRSSSELSDIRDGLGRSRKSIQIRLQSKGSISEGN